MTQYEEPLHQNAVKTSRIRAKIQPQPATLQQQASEFKEEAGAWMEAHPWRILGICLGAAGLLGYRLGVRS